MNTTYRGQSSIDAATGIEEVVSTWSIEGVGKKVVQNVFFRFLYSSICFQVPIKSFVSIIIDI